MDHEAEFAAYADDNWSTLVRSAVFLGCSLADAEDLAQTTLVKCYQAWGRVSAADNRDVVVLRYFAHLSEAQTAEVLGVPPGTVKSRLSRALAQLSADRHLADATEGSGHD